MNEVEKTTKTEKIESLLFSLQLVCVVLNVFCAIWQIHAITSAIIAVSFGITAALAFITISNKNNKYTVVLWLMIVALSYTCVSKGSASTSFEYLKVWIMFVTTINLFFWVYAVKVNNRIIKRIFICGVVTASIFIIGFLAERTKANAELPDLVTFGLPNPNLTGIFILNVFLCVFILTKFLKIKILRFVCYALCAVLFYFIWLTEARSCIIAAVTCLFLSIRPSKKYSKFITFAVLIFPIVFAILYLKLISTDFVNLFEFMTSEGKTLTSRVRIWEYTIEIVKNNIFLGNYYLGAGNMHNTHLMILAAFGVPTFSLVIIFLNRIVNYIGQFMKSKHQFTALYAFYAIIIMGTFEAALFSGSQEMYVFSGAFLLIAKYVAEKDLIKDKTTE